jgi:hypothetical protein
MTACVSSEKDHSKAIQGVVCPRLLLPAKGIDLYRWAVIACDQHTADPVYWEKTAAIVGQHPSTLHLILPEYLLEHPGSIPVRDRITQINQTMHSYLEQDILVEMGPGCMLIDRKTPFHDHRLGLLLAIDLECYDFEAGNQSLIRATEETVSERIPPREAIRRDAMLELPHIQLLIDDPENRVIKPLYTYVTDQEKTACYETPLMQNGGLVRGWFFGSASEQLERSLDGLKNLDSVRQYQLMMAVGDGNHSLATAKAHWIHHRERWGENHPSRYALVEIINLHDSGLTFEPIHRILKGLSWPAFYRAVRHAFGGQNVHLHKGTLPDCYRKDRIILTVLTGDETVGLEIMNQPEQMPTAWLQAFLDELAVSHSVQIDYIHGRDAVENLVQKGYIGLLLPALDKKDFFPMIARSGLMPRKSFSLGEACEKRYYIECRRIR